MFLTRKQASDQTQEIIDSSVPTILFSYYFAFVAFSAFVAAVSLGLALTFYIIHIHKVINLVAFLKLFLILFIFLSILLMIQLPILIVYRAYSIRLLMVCLKDDRIRKIDAQIMQIREGGLINKISHFGLLSCWVTPKDQSAPYHVYFKPKVGASVPVNGYIINLLDSRSGISWLLLRVVQLVWGGALRSRGRCFGYVFIDQQIFQKFVELELPSRKLTSTLPL